LIAFGLLWFAYKFLFIWVFDQPDEVETGGLFFPLAVSNLFVGLYIEQICLIGLFFIRVKVAKVASIVEGVLMIILALITLAFQILLRKSFDPLVEFLPMSLATRKMREKYEEKRTAQGIPGALIEELDLFSREHIRSVVTLKHKLENSARLRLPRGTSSTSTTSSRHALTAAERNSSPRARGPEAEPHIYLTPGPSAIPAEAVVRDSDEDGDVELAEHAFDHPSVYRAAPWIWVPKDILSLSTSIVQDLQNAGVEASDLGAFMDEKGTVHVKRSPPDSEWEGGVDI